MISGDLTASWWSLEWVRGIRETVFMGETVRGLGLWFRGLWRYSRHGMAQVRRDTHRNGQPKGKDFSGVIILKLRLIT